MDPLEEAHLIIFGTNAPAEISRVDLAELAVEGLSSLKHGQMLMRRCLEEISSDHTLPGQMRDWAEQELLPPASRAKSAV